MITNKINYGDLEKNKWYKITLIEPEKEVKIHKIPSDRGWSVYIAYNAYFTDLGSDHRFTISFPFFKFKRYVDSLPDSLKRGKNIRFEIKKGNHGRMEIKDWGVAEDERDTGRV